MNDATSWRRPVTGRKYITALYLGAHYVPVPGPKAFTCRDLFEDLGVSKNGQWEERYLAFQRRKRFFSTAAGRRALMARLSGLKTKRPATSFKRLEESF